MANYYASARTNYFELKNMDAFKEEMSNYGVEVSEKHGTEMVCLLGNDPDSGCFPSYNCETDEEVDFPQVVAPFLKNGWVAIFMEAGAEKLRYVHGHAVAINNEGEERFINLTEIYDLAAELGEYVTEAQY